MHCLSRAKSGEGGDIFSDAEDTPQDERGSSPAPDPLADDHRPAAAGMERPPRSSSKPSEGRAQPSTGGAERTDGADEERRLRLRQVRFAYTSKLPALAWCTAGQELLIGPASPLD